MMTTKKNLWILTEERPKREVITHILETFVKDHKFGCIVDTIRILPVLEDGNFTFTYEVTGFNCTKIDNVFIKSVSGYSSFCDFLIFYQQEQPTQADTPLYVIEETKTDDKESRNTGVYQRASKFVYLENYYTGFKNKIMLYNLSIGQKEEPTDTYIFGTRLLLALGIKIHGKKLNPKIFKPFKSVDEIIKFKAGMKSPPKGNVPITIKKVGKTITVTGRLVKSDSLAHDPNIGALSLISAVIRKLGWKDKIIISDHGLQKRHLKAGNKFVAIANQLDLKMKGLTLPVSKIKPNYWRYEEKGEKLGTIFLHLAVENFTEGYSIFENHAGCEKGYFITSDGESIALEKYSDREAYKKDGDKSAIIHIPDLILLDCYTTEIINIEGKKYENRKKGIAELNNFDAIEREYIKKHYPQYKIIRTVVLYGSVQNKLVEIKVGFLLNKNGQMVLGIKAPDLFKRAIKNLQDYWG